MGEGEKKRKAFIEKADKEGRTKLEK